MALIKRKAALITGGAVRMGRAITWALALDGWCVGIHCRGSEDEAGELATEIQMAGGKAVVLPADFLQEHEVENLYDRAEEQLGSLSLLINNASLFENDGVQSATSDSFERHIKVNLRAPMILCQRFAEKLPPGSEGNIINMVDHKVDNLRPDFLSYTLSKGGLWTLTQMLAMALAPRVRVNAIGPGHTLRGTRQSEEHFRAARARTPLQTAGGVEDVVRAVRFILTMPAMTGEMIHIDGGEHLGFDRSAQRFEGLDD